MKISTSIDFADDKITVTTRMKILFVAKPHSSVIPFLLNGRMTPEKGFMVFYSAVDDDVLQALHNALCYEVECGNYRAMREFVMRGQSPLVDEGMQLSQYILGFKL